MEFPIWVCEGQRAQQQFLSWQGHIPDCIPGNLHLLSPSSCCCWEPAARQALCLGSGRVGCWGALPWIPLASRLQQRRALENSCIMLWGLDNFNCFHITMLPYYFYYLSMFKIFKFVIWVMGFLCIMFNDSEYFHISKIESFSHIPIFRII